MKLPGLSIGCCGFPLAKEKYFQLFDVVEIQRTFYQPPSINIALKWQRQSPPNFKFSLKAWQLITHEASSPTYRRLKIKIPSSKLKFYGSFKPTEEVFSAWLTVEKVAEALKAKIILFQCPVSFQPEKKNINNLKRFFKNIDRKQRLFAFEPRGNWSENLIKGLCRDLNLIHCVDPFKARSQTAEVRYYRLHGIAGYNYRYTNEDLKWLYQLYQEFKREKMFVYVLFNNVYMLDDALRFKDLIKRMSV
jgi:uncharacterized protein YecE (DUF72 family)